MDDAGLRNRRNDLESSSFSRTRSASRKNHDERSISMKDHDAEQQQSGALSTFQLALIIFPLRLLNACTIKTFFQPDEFYQSLEPAHYLVFGTGYITWEWHQQLRSAVHPLIYALGYWIVQQLFPYDGFWQTQAVIYVPKAVGAVIATVAEVALYNFVVAYTGARSAAGNHELAGGSHELARLATWLSLASPFNMYFITRSFSNAFEMMLTTLALSWWPWHYRLQYRQLMMSCAVAFVSIIVRPTNAIIWCWLGVDFILHNHRYFKTGWVQLSQLVLVLVAEAGAVLAVTSGFDYLFYGQVTFPLYNFIEFNVVKKLSIFYGAAPWHFHVFQSVPIILMLYVVPFIHAMTLGGERGAVATGTLKAVVGVFVVGFSAIAHKEFRFIYPLQPIFMLLVAVSVEYWQRQHRGWTKKWSVYAVSGIVAVNLAIGVFFTQVHERGAIDVIRYLRTQPSQPSLSERLPKESLSDQPGEQAMRTVGFLTPCHSFPWQSLLHRGDFWLQSDGGDHGDGKDNAQQPIRSSWMLTCEPPLHVQSGNIAEILGYRDESDQFYDDPTGFLKHRFGRLPVRSEYGRRSEEGTPDSSRGAYASVQSDKLVVEADKYPGKPTTATGPQPTIAAPTITTPSGTIAGETIATPGTIAGGTIAMEVPRGLSPRDISADTHRQEDSDESDGAAPRYDWPDYLVIFEPLEEMMHEVLRGSDYGECKRFFNSYFHWDERRNGDIIVYCRDL